MSGTATESTLYRFHGPTDGTRPYSGLIDLNRNALRHDANRRQYNQGTVYAISPSGKENVVWSFKGKDGDDPRANLLAANGTIYGTTYYGGKAGTGTFFSVTPSGTEKVLHNFTGGVDGALPLGSLLVFYASPVFIYGTTSSGGTL